MLAGLAALVLAAAVAAFVGLRRRLLARDRLVVRSDLTRVPREGLLGIARRTSSPRSRRRGRRAR